MTAAQDRHRIRNFIAVISLGLGVLGSVVWFLNRPTSLQYILSMVSRASPWNFSIAELAFHPFDGSLQLKDFAALRDEDGNGIRAKLISARFSPFGFMRGKLVITDLMVDEFTANIASPDAKKRKKLNLAKLLLLRNLEVEKGKTGSVSINVGGKLGISLEESTFSVSRSLFGETEVAATVKSPKVMRSGELFAKAAIVTVDAETELSKWTQTFPYIGSISGGASVSGLDFKGIESGELNISGEYSGREVSLSKVSMAVGNGALIANAKANLESKEFSAEVEIPNPVYLPYFVRPMLTFESAGDLSAKISARGKGFSPLESVGSAKVLVAHRFDVAKDAPVQFSSDLSWAKGTIKLSNAKVLAGDDAVSIEGSVNLPSKKMSFSAEGSKFSSEHVMNKFKNKHLKKIFGPTDFTATFEGWGKDFHAHFSASVEGGGFMPITAELAKVELDITYDDLILDGEIFAGGKRTGGAKLAIEYGPATPADVPRAKNINLTGELKDHPAETSLGAFGISGIVSGEISISGPSTSFTGTSSGSIASGEIAGVFFDRLSAKMDLTPKQLDFSDISISAANVSSSDGKMKTDISEGKTRFYGAPINGVDIDVTYLAEAGAWEIKSANYADASGKNSLEVSGKYSSKGQADLKITADVQIEALKPFVRQISGGEGGAKANLAITGPSKDPLVSGTIAINAEDFSLRETRFLFDRVDGDLQLKGKTIIFDGLKAVSEGGSVDIAGSLEHRGAKPSAIDLRMSGQNLRFRSEDDQLNLEFTGSIALKGSFPNPVLSGDLSIIDGRYTRDFTIVDAITGGAKATTKKKKRANTSDFDPTLSLKIRTEGDLRIRNNVGDIWLSADIGLQGRRSKPLINGTINASEGEIHYLGVNFDVTKGFIEFREKYEEPYLELHAQRDLRTYTANLVLYGNMDNLALDLSATSASGPLEKRDVVSLIVFGATEQERSANPTTQSQMASSMAARSVSGIFEGQVSKITGLDEFRLESGDPSSSKISRVSIGKDVSDRLTFRFSTDINSDSAIQTIIAEYLLTDNLLLKAGSSTDQSYQLSGLLRFRRR